MAMHIIADFDRPLNPEQQRSLWIAIAPLAKAERVRVVRGGHRAVVIGEALGLERVKRVLAEAGLEAASVTSSLGSDEQQAVDEAGAVAEARERSRPIGR